MKLLILLTLALSAFGCINYTRCGTCIVNSCFWIQDKSDTFRCVPKDNINLAVRIYRTLSRCKAFDQLSTKTTDKGVETKNASILIDSGIVWKSLLSNFSSKIDSFSTTSLANKNVTATISPTQTPITTLKPTLGSTLHPSSSSTRPTNSVTQVTEISTIPTTAIPVSTITEKLNNTVTHRSKLTPIPTLWFVNMTQTTPPPDISYSFTTQNAIHIDSTVTEKPCVVCNCTNINTDTKTMESDGKAIRNATGRCRFRS